MGIPGYFKWLTNRFHYPDIIQDCIEHIQYDNDGPFDETQPNLHGVEFDNLYLDMNGIIHKTMAIQNISGLNNEDDLIHSIFHTIDEIFALVRPRKLLFIAIDGVAPLAKLHQKRSKRYLGLKEALDKAEAIKIIKSKILANGRVLPNPADQNEPFDEQCITPGTSFMLHLSDCLRYYIYDRMNTKSAWQSLRIICSDANVAGEGEHKIMNFIRQQCLQTNYDVNTRHVLFGTDADLIILGLSTHLDNISIMRDKLNLDCPPLCELCRQQGHDYKKCQGISKENQNILPMTPIHEKPKYIFVHLSKLHERLHDYFYNNCDFTFPWNFERFIDDWIFLCFLNGNDFLPDIPSFEIYQNSIDNLLEIYVRNVPAHNDYLTYNGQLNLTLLEIILTEFGKNEENIFKDRFQISQQWKIKQEELNQQQIKPAVNLQEVITINKQEFRSFRPTYVSNKVDPPVEQIHNIDYNVQLWENNWHSQYYQKKFQINSNQIQNQQKSVVEHYVRGLCWILEYYYHGVSSWDWYYPYYYAPFASDFQNLNIDGYINPNSQPFTPLEQLICLTSSNSMKYLPEQWQTKLLINPLTNDYALPYSITIDPNGKHYPSQYTVRLPFIDKSLVHKFIVEHEELLTSEEKQRNQETKDLLFFHSNCLENNIKTKKTNKNPLEIFKQLNIPGQIQIIIDDSQITSINQSVVSPLNNYNTIQNNQVFCVEYHT